MKFIFSAALCVQPDYKKPQAKGFSMYYNNWTKTQKQNIDCRANYWNRGQSKKCSVMLTELRKWNFETKLRVITLVKTTEPATSFSL